MALIFVIIELIFVMIREKMMGNGSLLWRMLRDIGREMPIKGF
jgi:hypothetical protein